MAQLVASITTEMLCNLLSEVGFCRIKEITDQVNQLVSVLLAIEKLLNNEKGDDERILKYGGTIRDLYYKIEDALEECAVEVAAAMFKDKRDEHEVTACMKRFSKIRLGSSHYIIAALKNISGNFKYLEHDINFFRYVFPDHDRGDQEEEKAEKSTGDSSQRAPNTGVNPMGQNSRKRWPRQGYPGGTREYFVGRKDDLLKLKNLIMEEKKHFVVSIWGQAGMGKTSIVRKIYNDPQVRKLFKGFAWISQKDDDPIDIVPVFKDILRQLGQSQNVAEIIEELAKQLKKIQGQKNCLIVFDRIEQIDMWRRVRAQLDFNRVDSEGKSTKILLTTRDSEIAEEDGLPYELKPLDEDGGWELLKHHAFPDKVSSATDLGLFPKVGKEMVSKCGGLPSAISSLGRKLIGKTNLNDWHTVNNDIAQHLQSDHHSEGEEGFFIDPASRYDDLPYNLRQCFLYLGGMFWQNESIDAQDLMLLWMAEGMVSPLDKSREGSMIRTARSYLMELAEKGMLEVRLDEFSGNRRFHVCYLHHRVRELSLFQGEKEDFRLKVVDLCDGNRSVLDPLATLTDETRRLIMHFREIVKLSMQQRNSMRKNIDAMIHIRSLVFLNHGKICTDLPVTLDFEKFKLLRVLHFVRCKFEMGSLPKGICKLINLRYLGLLYCDLEELPRDLIKLRNLNVLNLRVHATAQIKLQPDVLCRMVNLKHMSLPHYSDSEQTQKLSLDKLAELETLIGFNNLIHDLSSLPKLEKLRRLEAHAYSNECLVSLIKFIRLHGDRTRTNLCIENKCDFTSPEGLPILEETLMCTNLYELTLSMVLIHKFPDCGTYFSSELTQLKLIGCKIKEDPMETLGKFPNLQKLCLGYGAYVGEKMVVKKGGYKSLEYLELHSLPKLEDFEVHEGAMPKLSGLVICRCPEMERIPCGFANVRTLKSMDVELTPDGLADNKEEKYRTTFGFVKSFRIRKLDSVV